jgi:hypothetical protein
MNPALSLLTLAFILHQAPAVGAAELAPAPVTLTPQVATPVTADEAQQVKALLDQLPPSQATVWRYIAQTKGKGNNVSPEELRAADESLAKVREVIPKLRKLLKVGTSVFNYPSLLAHGDITYQIIKASGANSFAEPAAPVEYGYRLYMGIPKSEFTHIYDFELLFDSQGVIRAINSVDWKK